MNTRPHTTGMTRWSRDESVRSYGNTDHWSKLKVKSGSFMDARSSNDAGKEDIFEINSVKNFGHPTFVKSSSEHHKFYNYTRSTTQLPLVSGEDTSHRKLTVLPNGDLTVVITKSGLKKHWLNNSYQRRAREGFRYWLINKPPPTSCKFGYAAATHVSWPTLIY
uniref:Uncharacterized protein n=1 Tax=Arion vulgaris TaxID=1028688 RepID=A0A0B6YPF2_9EUPU